MRWKKAGITVGVFAGVFLIMKYAVPVMLPFLLGGLLALAILPAARWLADRKLCRKLHFTEGGIGAVLILLLSVGSILGFMWLLQALSTQIGRLISYYPVIKKEFCQIIGQCCRQVEYTMGIPAQESSQYIYMQLNNLGSSFFGGSQSMEAAVDSMKTCVVVVGGLILCVVSAVLILQEHGDWKAQFASWPVFVKIRNLFRNLKNGIAEYFKAQIKIMGIIILLCIAGLFLLGTSHFLLAGLALGLLDALPVLGTGTFLVPAALVLALRGNAVGAVGCIALYLVTSCVRQFLEPRLIGKKVGVSPLLVLLSVYLGLFLYGGAGFLLGPLSALVIYGILREWNLLDYGKNE
ncbi:MAG: AI-2E family transporter [Blautia sp.]|uniref:AI-2E family transporter n=1 Tax=Blautia TaxID=572511 RepID=UPI00139068E6|nr:MULTISPECIES: AI-2E family transporter [Blautia]MDR3894091.1 AI-2E family transporter [Blautia sp.]